MTNKFLSLACAIMYIPFLCLGTYWMCTTKHIELFLLSMFYVMYCSIMMAWNMITYQNGK